MRIALDARWMQRQPVGGVGRTLANVVSRVPEAVDLHLLTDARYPALAGDRPQHPLETPWPGHASVWLQWSAPRWLREFGGVFHCPFYGLPFRQPVPMVVTIHDLTFEDHPEWFPRGRAATFRLQARHAARTARIVLTVSEHVAGQLTERYAVPPDRLRVAPPGVDEVFGTTPDPSWVRRRFGLRDDYIVALGGGPRRNLPIAIDAWQLLTRSSPADLVVVGTARPPDLPGLKAVGRVDDAAWAALLRGARLLLYPTADEGFGMPALEAIASGTPVVCARRGALPEVLGEAAAWADALTPEALATAADPVMSTASVHDRLVSAGLERARAAPGWDATAAAHVEAWTAAGG